MSISLLFVPPTFDNVLFKFIAIHCRIYTCIRIYISHSSCVIITPFFLNTSTQYFDIFLYHLSTSTTLPFIFLDSYAIIRAAELKGEFMGNLGSVSLQQVRGDRGLYNSIMKCDLFCIYLSLSS